MVDERWLRVAQQVYPHLKWEQRDNGEVWAFINPHRVLFFEPMNNDTQALALIVWAMKTGVTSHVTNGVLYIDNIAVTGSGTPNEEDVLSAFIYSAKKLVS